MCAHRDSPQCHHRSHRHHPRGPWTAGHHIEDDGEIEEAGSGGDVGDAGRARPVASTPGSRWVGCQAPGSPLPGSSRNLFAASATEPEPDRVS
jgi:hypothetical protein